jgi:poly(3-hydroxybutyrate) depolymerase
MGNCHLVSVCQPTVPVLAAVSLMATRGELTPLSMTMMGGPIDARKSPTAVNNLAMTKSHSWFEKNVIYRVPSNFPGAGRRVYPGFLQYAGFVAMNPSNHARSHYDYFKDLIKGDGASTEAHRKFYDEYNAVLDMDANYYLQTIKVVFQDFSLVNGTWDIRNPQGQLERVRPQDIKTTALFSVEGELDDISGSGQTEAVHAICSGVVDSEQRHLIVEGAGHYGIFSGRRWREVVYPEVKKFILAHQPSPAPTATQSSESSPSITPTRPAATKKAAKKPAAAKPTAAAKPVGTVAEASLAAPTPTRSKAVTNKKAVPAKRTPATASGKSAPRTARRK